MKTAKAIVFALETYNSVSESPMVCVSRIALISTFESELLDAYKAGMTKSAELIHPEIPETKQETIERILSARDKKETI